MRERGATRLLARTGLDRPERAPKVWVAPLERCIVGEVLGNRRWTLDEYLTVIDATGRMIRAGKRGVIAPELGPILARLDLQVEDWITTMLGWRQMRGSGIGAAEARAVEATRRGLRWVKNQCPLFARKTAA